MTRQEQPRGRQISLYFVHSNEQQASRRESFIDICELNLRKLLADIFVRNGCGVVRVDPIMSGSQFKRLCALHPKEKMRSHRRPFNTICTTKTTAFFSVDSWRDTW